MVPPMPSPMPARPPIPGSEPPPTLASGIPPLMEALPRPPRRPPPPPIGMPVLMVMETCLAQGESVRTRWMSFSVHVLGGFVHGSAALSGRGSAAAREASRVRRGIGGSISGTPPTIYRTRMSD